MTQDYKEYLDYSNILQFTSTNPTPYRMGFEHALYMGVYAAPFTAIERKSYNEGHRDGQQARKAEAAQ